MLRSCLALLAVALAGSACSTDFDASGPPPEAAFSVFGTLDTLDRPVRVRIEDVRRTAEKETDTPLTATLTDTRTGVATTATVRVVGDGAGGTARVAEFATVVAHGRVYRLDLVGAAVGGGAGARTATATATVPARRLARVDAPESDSTGRVRQGVVFAGADVPAEVPVLVYRIVRTATDVALAGDTLEVDVPGALRGQTVGGGYRVWVSPREDAPELLSRLGVPSSRAARVRVLAVTVRIAERGPEWAFAEARTGPHLTRARGVFVAVGRSSAMFVPDVRALASAGLRP